MPLPKDNLLFGFAPKLTNEQKDFVDSIFDNQLTIVNAKSGTGKTTLAVAVAKMIGKDLIYVFSPVEENRMGYRPGTQEEKERNYITPLMDALQAIGDNPNDAICCLDDLSVPGKAKEIKKAIEAKKMWVFPQSHVFARGINMKNKTVIIDEAQNFTKDELRKVLTRIHDDCTVILIGHTGQIDLLDKSQSGFEAYIEHFKNEDYVKVCSLNHNFRGRLAQKADSLV